MDLLFIQYYYSVFVYFADVVDRAYMISKNKAVFFNQEALAEANRYEAALYTAIEYNQPRCVEIMMRFLGAKEPGKHLFYTKGDTTESLGAQELADIRGERKLPVYST